MPERVAVVLPSFAGGGAERVAITLAGGLDRRRFDPHLVVLDATGVLAPLAEGFALPVVSLGRRRLRDALIALPRALRALAPAAIVSTLGYVNLALAAMLPLLPAPCRLILREANPPSHSLGEGIKGHLCRAAARLLYRRATRLICPSARILAELRDDIGLPVERLVLLPNPVDVAAVRCAARPARRVPGPGPRFVAAGRLTRQKGFDRLLDWFADAPPDACLTILGDGPERAQLAARAGALGGRVRLCGHVASPWADYAGADAFLMPSRWEGMPNAALESLAVGTPVIATAESGGLADLNAELPAGALTLASSDRDFAAAMAVVMPRLHLAERPSLLPDRFARERVLAAFSRILIGSTADD